MKKQKIFWENTTVPANRTVQEITECLVESGCTGIAMDYKDGNISALYFKIMFLNQTIPFRLPCRVDELKATYKKLGKYIAPEKAEMIAWRQTLYWVKAQLAMIGTNMIKVHEVFLPYMQTDVEGTTLFEKMEQTQFQLLDHKQ